MASPGGTVIGRVSVKVLPDTDDFRRRAQNELDRIEKQLRFKVKIELDTSGLAQQLNRVKNEIDRWRRGVDPVKVSVQLDLNGVQTAYIRSRLELLTRPRSVSIIPVLNEGAAARVMAALAALSGGRVLGDLLTNLKNIGTEFDRWAPKIGAASLAIGGLASLLLTSVSNMFALTLAVSQMATAAFALPALFSGAAIGAGIVVVALTQMKAAVPDIFESFKSLAQLIGKNFWAEAAGGIRELTSLYLPELGKTASMIGSFFGTLASDVAEPFKKALPAMFADLNKSIAITSGATEAFAGIITSLGQTGSQYLPQFATWIADLATQFDTFLKNASASGALQAWIDAGIQGFKDLGSILLDAGQIIGDIGKAATLGGGSTLGILADTMERIRAVTSSPEFQIVLVEVFQAAHKVMSQIAEIAGPSLIDFFSKLGETFVRIAPALGAGLGTALGAIADALASPAFTDAIVVLFNGLATAITALAPALPPVANAIGALAPVVATLLNVIAPLVTAALIPLSVIVEKLAPLFVPLIQLLGDTLLSAVTSLAPLLVVLADAFVQIGTILLDTLTPLLPVLATSFDQIVTSLLPLLPALTDLLLAIVVPLIPLLSDMIVTLLPAWANIMQLLQPVVVALIGVLTGLVTIVQTFLVPWLNFLWGIFKEKILPVIMGFADITSKATALVYGAINWLMGQIQPMLDTFTGWFRTMSTGVNLALGAVVTTLANLPQIISGIFSGAGEWLKNAGKSIIDGLVKGLRDGFQAVKDTLSGLTNLLPDWKGPASKDGVLLFDAGQLIINGLIDGLESRYGAVKSSLEGLTKDVGNTALGAAKASGIGAAIDGAMSGSLNDGTTVKVLNYYAGNAGLSSEEDLFAAADRARMVGW